MNVHHLLPELNPEEQKIFERSWRKNDIGLPIDLELANAIAARRSEIEHEASTQLRELTNNMVTAITQRQRILTWSNEFPRVANLPGTKKHEVAEALENSDLHPDVRTVLEILQENGGSAPMKAQALLNRHIGGFYKDATRYHGARSGRGTSEGANLFNIARPSGKYQIDELIRGLKAGFKYPNVALTDALRGCIIAPNGYALIDNDQSNAELRLALWQAHDEERLNILSNVGDIYMYNAITMWGLPSTATKDTYTTERYNGNTITVGANYKLGWNI
jgi:DNA polymerase